MIEKHGPGFLDDPTASASGVAQEVIDDIHKPVKQKAIKQIKPDARQCIYCHSGIYIEAFDSRKLSGHQLVNELLDWGISYHPAHPSRDWIIFSCNYCGNLQVFNVANVQNTKAWK